MDWVGLGKKGGTHHPCPLELTVRKGDVDIKHPARVSPALGCPPTSFYSFAHPLFKQFLICGGLRIWSLSQEPDVKIRWTEAANGWLGSKAQSRANHRDKGANRSSLYTRGTVTWTRRAVDAEAGDCPTDGSASF